MSYGRVMVRHTVIPHLHILCHHLFSPSEDHSELPKLTIINNIKGQLFSEK